MDWTVLLLGGSSRVGKTALAKKIGQHFGISWLQVDDFRLSLQRSLVSLQPESSIKALDFFDIEKNPTVWQLPPENNGQWLAKEAQHYGLPVLTARPWATLLERLLITYGT